MGFEFDPSQLTVSMEKLRKLMATSGRRKAVIAGARVIGAAMVENTPVLAGTNMGSDSLEPGELKANVKVRTRQEDGETVGLAGPSGKEGKIGKIAYNVEYGHRMVVGGKSKLNARGEFEGEGRVVGDVAPHSFLRPAFEASASAALEAAGEALSEELKGTAANG